tara:strand:- start:468 stop:701 length:234 start_codon:yes stop_codon:yes gene_type:complete
MKHETIRTMNAKWKDWRLEEDINEVSNPLASKLYHALEDVDALIDAVNSEEADDAFQNPKLSKKLLDVAEKALKKVK